ncbi:B3 domain-containing protein [Rhynchospora pubera]|uniref:B3 domain-containing protein n=1 Tax=Rhynchospora pubera TaxID=906938 RepID=A0AAV8EKE7_9POAL|nr:B3 domain-containing protein [Rhynchospora pubera]
MEQSCKVCRKWQRHFYWNHMDPKNVKFFVKMEASNRNHLDLPRKFARNFKGKIREIVKLTGPSGKAWQIEVLKTKNKLSLKSGWRNFVHTNKIDENDLLVFKYSGNSAFDVLIFDPSGSEKVASFTIKNETETEAEAESESESDAEKTSSESDTSIRVFIPPKRISSDIEISSSATGEQKMSVLNDTGSSRQIKKAKQSTCDRSYFMSWNLEMSVAEQKIADEMATATQPGSKLFVKSLTPSDARNLSIPQCFANENIVKESQPISLQLANKEKVFCARYMCSSRRNRQYIGYGWSDFVQEYKLKDGNLCLFEVKKLDQREKFVIVVHVLHLREN